MNGVVSPCINVCSLDPSGRSCLGCYRTIDEIANWASMPEEGKARVIAMLPARRLQAESPSSGAPHASETNRPC
jgi:uncharacterized protein